METRKVQLTGGSTYTVSLPKGWAGDHGIEAGVQLHLYPHEDGSIEVRPAPSGDGVRNVRAAVGDQSPVAIETTVEILYAVGVDECTLEADGGFDRDQREAIESAAGRLLGLEIFEADPERFVLRTLLRTVDVSVRQSVDQLRLTTLSMHRTAVSAAVDGGRAEHVLDRAQDASRLYALVARSHDRALTDLSEVDRLGIGRSALADHVATARQLDRLSRQATRLVERTMDRQPLSGIDGAVDTGIDADFESLAGRAREVVADASEAVLGEPDAEAAYDALAAREGVASTIATAEPEAVGQGTVDSGIRWLVLDEARRAADLGAAVARIVIWAAARRDEM
jgi:phosphate uptake regulator